ncbi:Hypothetical predicted protein [Marmota monax]|uniref:Uncharacterized protein n=1 Tax=Marmota monax TaxID=9995 RepID=A0A5E4A3D3_MARMO|nr:Hypothetical predicted protein [Marmota monax]
MWATPLVPSRGERIRTPRATRGDPPHAASTSPSEKAKNAENSVQMGTHIRRKGNSDMSNDGLPTNSHEFLYLSHFSAVELKLDVPKPACAWFCPTLQPALVT